MDPLDEYSTSMSWTELLFILNIFTFVLWLQEDHKARAWYLTYFPFTYIVGLSVSHDSFLSSAQLNTVAKLWNPHFALST